MKRKPVCPLLKLRHGVCVRTYLGQEAILLIIRYSALRQNHTLFQSEFSRVRSSVSYFNFQRGFISLRSCGVCLSLLPRLPSPSTFPSLFPSIIYFLRHFLHKMWPIPLAFLRFVLCWTFISSLILRTTSIFTRSAQPIFSAHLHHHSSKLLGYVYLIHFPKCSSFNIIQSYATNVAFY